MATTQPYEILMRRNGQSWALQARSLTTLDDGTAIEGKAVPLAGLSDPAFAEVAELVGASKDNEIATLTTDLGKTTAERDSLASEKAALTTERDSLQSQVTELMTSRDGLQVQLTEATTSLATATGQVETLTSERDSALEQVATLENRITELTAEPEVPIVSRRQARLALLEMGYFEAVETAVYEGPKAGQIEYEADTWRRDNPTLIVMAKSLGMSDEQIDQFFTLAGSK